MGLTMNYSLKITDLIKYKSSSNRIAGANPINKSLVDNFTQKELTVLADSLKDLSSKLSDLSQNIALS